MQHGTSTKVARSIAAAQGITTLRAALDYTETHGLPTGLSYQVRPERIDMFSGSLADVLTWARTLGAQPSIYLTNQNTQLDGSPGIQADVQGEFAPGLKVSVSGCSPCDISGDHDHDGCPARVLAEYRAAPVEPAGQAPDRQFCRKGIHSCVPAVTLTFDGGRGRLHWCAEHAGDAEKYRASSDQAVAPMPLAGDDETAGSTR